uniref:Putative ovule protein n=1 Tax=Solanum chacoense TaxID=4108 RepID=A0A0V0HP13_SOLCH
MVHTQFNKKIQVFRSDNGSEFLINIVQIFFNPLVLFIKVLVNIPLNKMGWYRGDRGIYLKHSSY